MIDCEHWRDCGIRGGGCCGIDEYERPSVGVCLHVCQKHTNKRHEDTNKPSRGLGDTVAKAIKRATGGKVKPCGGCKKRQAALNKLMPYGDKHG